MVLLLPIKAGMLSFPNRWRTMHWLSVWLYLDLPVWVGEIEKACVCMCVQPIVGMLCMQLDQLGHILHRSTRHLEFFQAVCANLAAETRKHKPVALDIVMQRTTVQVGQYSVLLLKGRLFNLGRWFLNGRRNK